MHGGTATEYPYKQNIYTNLHLLKRIQLEQHCPQNVMPRYDTTHINDDLRPTLFRIYIYTETNFAVNTNVIFNIIE